MDFNQVKKDSRKDSIFCYLIRYQDKRQKEKDKSLVMMIIIMLSL